jgi:hypothetical protein
MTEAHDVNVNLTIKRAPKVHRKRPVLDVLVILFASALIATAFGSAGSVVFGIVASVAILLYLLDARGRNLRVGGSAK